MKRKYIKHVSIFGRKTMTTITVDIKFAINVSYQTCRMYTLNKSKKIVYFKII